MTSPASRHTTNPADRIPWIQLIAYGLGGFVPIALFNSVGQLSGLILNVGLGISAILVGVAQMVPRLWDAVTDPIMGHISDNTRGGGGGGGPTSSSAAWRCRSRSWRCGPSPRDWDPTAQFWFFCRCRWCSTPR
jgi:hypothetical protein